jgi:four helix bundle protein
MGPHKNLQVWQYSMALVSLVYKMTRKFPRYEVFGLSSQMQRAAVSIPSNIAEGYGRDSNPDLIHFLHIALGSSNELDTQILIARNEEYITEEEFHQLEDLNDNVMRMLQSLIYTRKKYEMQTGQTSKP